MPDYPEHEKLHKVKDDSQVIGEFLDLGPWTLCEYRPEADVPRWIDSEGRPVGFFDEGSVENPDWYPEGYYPVRETVPQILAHYFNIDLDKIEEEKLAMLEDIRAQR